MNIAIIYRGLVERKNIGIPPHHRRATDINDIKNCRESVVINVSTPLETKGHTVSHLAAGYYDDFDDTHIISSARQDFFGWYDQTHLQSLKKNGFGQLELFKKIIEPGTFDLDTFDMLIIIRFDCWFKPHEMWSEITAFNDRDLTVPWIEKSFRMDEPGKRNLPDTIHIIHRPHENIPRLNQALDTFIHQLRTGVIRNYNGMHNIECVLDDFQIKTMVNTIHSSGADQNPFYYIKDLPHR